jgi:hypothetical protein
VVLHAGMDVIAVCHIERLKGSKLSHTANGKHEGMKASGAKERSSKLWAVRREI